MSDSTIIYFCISILFSIAYLLVMWRYLYHWKRLPRWETPNEYEAATSISVIIPVRNEAENIKACIQSILNQNYPKALLEVIVLDDHSTDSTFSILQQMNDERLKVLRLQDFLKSTKTNAFKKKAIEIGVEQSKGKLILTTDGDCIVPKRWLQRMAHFYEKNDLKFIAAPVNFYKEENLLEQFQSLDFTGMMGVTGAGIHGRFMNMCNGANLAYDREAFFEVGGFSGVDHLASGDDMLLLQKIAKRFPDQIAFLKNVEATVFTKAQPTLNAFVNQRIRWASKSSDYKEWQVTAMLGIVWLFCWSIVLSLGSIFILGVYGLWILGLQFFIKIIVDFLLLRATTNFFNRRALMRYFLPAQIMHILYIVIIGTMSLFVKKYSWKGRSVK